MELSVPGSQVSANTALYHLNTSETDFMLDKLMFILQEVISVASLSD